MTRKLALLLALALMVACGGNGGTSGDTDTADSQVDSTSEPDGESPSGEESLADFFGYGEEDTEAQEADYRDQEARVQETIRQCMVEQGFEYQPVVPPEDAFGVWDESSEEERVREQGFGITTWYGNEDDMDMGMEWEDPNQEMLEDMSESEREAWNEALYGTQEEQEADMEVEEDPETGETILMGTGMGAGCQGEAYESEYGDPGDTQNLWEDLQPAMDSMYEQVEADPRIVEWNQEWSSCMAEAGYEVTTRNDMWETVYEDFQERFDEIVGPNGGFADPFEGMSEDEINAFFEESSQEEIDAFLADAEEKSRENVDMKAVEALQQEEIEMAVADFECGEGFNDLYQEVSGEYEAEFIAGNRDTLEQIREAQGD